MQACLFPPSNSIFLGDTAGSVQTSILHRASITSSSYQHIVNDYRSRGEQHPARFTTPSLFETYHILLCTSGVTPAATRATC
jgi:hypothetical protein